MHSEYSHLVAGVSCNCIKHAEKPWSSCYWNKREECKETVKVLCNCTRKNQSEKHWGDNLVGWVFALLARETKQWTGKKEFRSDLV